MIRASIITSLALGLIACGGDSSSYGVADATEIAPDGANINTCFWGGPYIKEIPSRHFAYPDTGAAYWAVQYTLPEGARLKLKGDFPYARYISFNSYRSDSTPAHAISDNAIVPNPGAINPFVDGAERQSEFRGYELEVAAGEAPENEAANTLYDYAEDGVSTLLYRVYVPDEGNDLAGGVKLPEVEVTLADGSTVSGEAACEVVGASSDKITVPRIPAKTYAAVRQNNPADDPPVWRAAYNFAYSLSCVFNGNCDPNPEREVAWFANLDNQYISTHLDRTIKPVVVIRGEIPATPETLSGEEYFDTSSSELRYWSICQNEFYSQKVQACLYDEQISINPDGKYTIVTSLAEDRPSNAISDCGIGYLEWAENGDGFSIIDGQEDDLSKSLLIVRNMKPMNGFAQTVQNTETPGDEGAVMGEYLPTAQYFTTEEFEALGCDAYNSL